MNSLPSARLKLFLHSVAHKVFPTHSLTSVMEGSMVKISEKLY